MIKATMRVILRTDRTSNGKHPIVIKIYTKGKNKYVTTAYKVSTKDWLEEKERTKSNVIINSYLDDLSSKFNRTLMDAPKGLDAETLAGIIFENSDNLKIGLLNFVKYYIEIKKLKNDVKPKTISRYSRMLVVLESFLKSIKRPTLLLSDVDFEIVNHWDTYVKSSITINEKQLETNTINKYHSLFRTILLQAFHESKLKQNPYKLFKLKSKPTKRCFLTESELNTFKNKCFSLDRDEKIRLIYLFSCYTGIRFNDAQRLNKNNLIKGPNGKMYLSFQSSKSDKQQELPLLDDAVTIINEIALKFTLELSITGKLLPKISNQKCNDYLKLIALQVGINKPLTHHTARHTYATFMLSRNVSPQALQTLLGHSNLRETMIYAKITPNYLLSEVEKGNFKPLNN